MLEIAFAHQEALNKAWQKCIHSEHFKYYCISPHFDLEIKCSDNTWDSLQMVSMSEAGEIIGYMSASLDRAGDMVSGISAINFGDMSLTFSRDLMGFLVALFEVHRFRKVEWSVIVGNPAEVMYDRIVKKYGGRITGLRRETVRLYDGRYYDMKSYELFRDAFITANAARKEAKP
ncbi:MAG: hypothetical protein AAGU74_08350 [Bacillota bacterium]